MSAAYNLVPLLFHVTIAALVVRVLNAALWGEMVQVLVWTGLAGNVIAWGNKDFLIREISTGITTMREKWQISFGSRSLIYVFVVALLFVLPIPIPEKSWIALYITARFIYTSYDPVIITRRHFMITILLELAGFLLIAGCIYLLHRQTLVAVLSWFVLAELLKAACITIWYRKELLPLFFKNFKSGYFQEAFFFFLLYFTGMLATKIDLLAATYLLSNEAIAKYQVLMSFVLATQLTIPILLLPYLTVIYRMPMNMIRKVAFRLMLVGMLLCSAAIFAISLILEFFFHFKYMPVTFFLAWLFAVPGFYFAPLIYRFFKNNRQQVVVRIALANIIISAMLIAASITIFADTFNAVLLAMASAQCIQAIVYFFSARKIR